MTEEHKVIIHIGPSKTGSSALQYQLNNHRNTLKECGIYYPTHGVDVNNISAGHLNTLYEKDVFNNFIFSKVKYDRLISDFSKSGCHTLLLSSEFFFAHLSTVSQYFPQAVYVAYIRNPLELISSEYNQTVKRHNNWHTFTFSMIEFNVLQRIESGFSHLNFMLKPYLAGGSLDWDISHDFFQLLGISKPPQKERTNRSYSFEALELKRHLNYFPLGKLDEPLDLVLQKFDVKHDSYSILSNAEYEQNKITLLHQLNEFIEKNNNKELLPLVAHIENSTNLNYKRQNSVKDFSPLINFIKEQNVSLFKDIQNLLFEHKYTLCDGDICQLFLLISNENLSDAGNLYAQFNVDLSHVNAALSRLSDRFDSIVSNDSIRDKADLTREIALIFEKESMHQYATLMMTLASSFRPDGPVIQEKLKKYTQS